MKSKNNTAGSWGTVICILATIALAVAKSAGWIAVSWWIVFIPMAVLTAWVVFALIVVAVLTVIVFAAEPNNKNKKINRYGRY